MTYEGPHDLSAKDPYLGPKARWCAAAAEELGPGMPVRGAFVVTTGAPPPVWIATAMLGLLGARRHVAIHVDGALRVHRFRRHGLGKLVAEHRFTQTAAPRRTFMGIAAGDTRYGVWPGYGADAAAMVARETRAVAGA